MKYKKYYNCIFSIECNLRKHGAVTNQTTWNSIQRHWISLIVWFGWPAVWAARNQLIQQSSISFSINPTKDNFLSLCCWLMRWNDELMSCWVAAPHQTNHKSMNFIPMKIHLICWCCLGLQREALARSPHVKWKDWFVLIPFKQFNFSITHPWIVGALVCLLRSIMAASRL